MEVGCWLLPGQVPGAFESDLAVEEDEDEEEEEEEEEQPKKKKKSATRREQNKQSSREWRQRQKEDKSALTKALNAAVAERDALRAELAQSQAASAQFASAADDYRLAAWLIHLRNKQQQHRSLPHGSPAVGDDE